MVAAPLEPVIHHILMIKESPVFCLAVLRDSMKSRLRLTSFLGLDNHTNELADVIQCSSIRYSPSSTHRLAPFTCPAFRTAPCETSLLTSASEISAQLVHMLPIII